MAFLGLCISLSSRTVPVCRVKFGSAKPLNASSRESSELQFNYLILHLQIHFVPSFQLFALAMSVSTFCVKLMPYEHVGRQQPLWS
ncbi:hypothetical protein Scep_029228 [Stephania cephalantha]|uniref:Uncharacterized protein n=1 Tax=Stephania cephalantha TaxID=152367 RepID=A0AAP0E1Q6_9MAGN